MKKRMLDCPVHGLSLHSCRRKYWHNQKGSHTNDYIEKCFMCIQEGRYVGKVRIVKEQKHISLK